MSETRAVSATQARRAILKAFKTKRPVFLWGPPGIGKSEVVEGITNELGGLMIDLRLGQMEPTDLRGIPYYNKDKGVMDWAPPVELPDEELASQYPIVVLFFDELNTGSPSVQAATYQLILNRRIGKHRLPDNVVMIAAGNRESDKGVTYRMPTPLSNRFIHLEMKVDFDSWESWAIANDIHQDVVAYVTFAKQDLYDFDSRSASRAFATPRTWTYVSELLKDEDTDDDTLINLISGTIGEGLALKFMSHRKLAGKLPRASDILDGKVDKLKVKDISAQYSLAVSMCYELKDTYETDKTKFAEQFNNFLAFCMKHFETELVVMAVRLAIGTHHFETRYMMDNEVYDEFQDKFGKYVMKSQAN